MEHLWGNKLRAVYGRKSVPALPGAVVRCVWPWHEYSNLVRPFVHTTTYDITVTGMKYIVWTTRASKHRMHRKPRLTQRAPLSGADIEPHVGLDVDVGIRIIFFFVIVAAHAAYGTDGPILVNVFVNTVAMRLAARVGGLHGCGVGETLTIVTIRECEKAGDTLQGAAGNAHHVSS